MNNNLPIEDHYRQRLQMQKQHLAQQYQSQAQHSRERKQQQQQQPGQQPTRLFETQNQSYSNPYLAKKQNQKQQEQSQQHQSQSSTVFSGEQSIQQVPPNMAGGNQVPRQQNLNQSYFSQISSVAGGNGNAAQSSSMGLGSVNMAFGAAGQMQAYPPEGHSGNNSKLSMSNMSIQYNGQSLVDGFQNHQSAGGAQNMRVVQNGGNQNNASVGPNYMAVGPNADKNSSANGSALAQMNGSRGPNSSVLSTHSAAAKIRGNSYTPMLDRGGLRDQNQNNFQTDHAPSQTNTQPQVARQINNQKQTEDAAGPTGAKYAADGKLHLNELNTGNGTENNAKQQQQVMLQNSASADIERDLADLPQAKSQMMASYERQQENFFRPPNVYRQTLNVDNLITVCSKKLREDPNHKKALFIRASSFLKKGQFEQSIDDCNHLMQLDAMHAGAYYVRGCAFEKLDMVDRSIDDFTKVLEIDPHHINAAYARGACENKRGNFAKAIDDYNMALAIDKERTMSPSLNRRLPFRATQSNILDMSHVNGHNRIANGSKMDSNSNSMISYSSKTGYNRNMGALGSREDQRGHSPIGNNSYLAEKNLQMNGGDPNPTHSGKHGQQNTALMSPSVNQSSRAGFMNETRISMQSSLLKTADGGRIQNMNQSIGGTSLVSASRNNNVTQVNVNNNPQNDMRPVSINSSIDLKNTTQYSIQNMSLNGTGLLVNHLLQDNNHSATRQDHQGTEKRTAARKTGADAQGWANQEEYNKYISQKKQADDFHAKGYEARKKSDYQTAIQYYTRALDIMPNHFKALFNRGFACDKIGQFDNAIQDYSKAIEIDPNNAYTYYNKGISLDRKGDYDEAIKCFSKAISIEPSKADFYHNRGFAYRKKREFDNAIKDYQNAIQIDPHHFKAYYNRAFCWDKLGKYDQSEADYQSSVDLQPKNISALHHLGTIREKIGGDKLDMALENFNEVIRIDSSYAPSYNGRGLVWDRFFKFDEAIKDFTRAIEIDKKNPVYLHNRGCCYRNMGDLENSIMDFDEAIKLDDKNPIIYSNRGLVNRKLERFELAIQDYSNEIKYGVQDSQGRSNNIKAFNNRAYCLAKLGRYKEAIVDYTTVIQQDKTNIHALHNRGISYERLARYKEAVKDFSRVIEIDPQNANAYFNRGCCYDSIGELDLAISDYSVALELDLRSGNEDVDEQGDDDENEEADGTSPNVKAQNAQLPPRPTPVRNDPKRAVRPPPDTQDEEDFNVNETEREGYSPNRKNINKDVPLSFNQRSDLRGPDDGPLHPSNQLLQLRPANDGAPSWPAGAGLAQQDKDLGNPPQNNGNLFRSKFLTQNSTVQMDRGTREQVAFERGDPRQEAGTASAYSSVLSAQQPHNGSLIGAQALRQSTAAAPSNQSFSGHPIQADSQQRRGVNEYLQKKYSQKFNLH